MMRKTHDWRHHIDSPIELFKEDLPSALSVPYVVSEVHQLRPVEAANIPLQALIQCDEKFFPNIFRLLKIVVALPMTTCEAERHFSALRRLKIFLRTETLEDHLNGLALLRIHRKVNKHLDFAVDEFARRYNCRFVLRWISQVEVSLAPLGQ